MTVLDQHVGGRTDIRLASLCWQERRALVTLDIDSDDIRTYPPASFFGLIVLRLRRQDKPHVLDVLTRLMQAFSREPLERHLWIVEENRLRIRG